MDTYAENSVLINAPFDFVWSQTNDVERWPSFFKEYASCEILHREGATVRFRLTTRTSPPRSWVSERTLDRDAGVALGRRVETEDGPFEYWRIRCEYTPVDGGVALTWRQEFKLRRRIPLVDGVKAAFFHYNTKRHMGMVMSQIKQLIEAAAVQPLLTQAQAT